MRRDAIIVNTDWSRLTFGQQIRHLEVEGYVVLPGMLSPDLVKLPVNPYSLGYGSEKPRSTVFFEKSLSVAA